MDYKKAIQDKMKNMEVSPHKRKGMSVEALKSADHNKLSLDAMKKKARSISGLSKPAAEGADQPESPEVEKSFKASASRSVEDIDVTLIRNKDRSVDASDPVGERTIIFNKGGDIMGSQG